VIGAGTFFVYGGDKMDNGVLDISSFYEDLSFCLFRAFYKI
jgi:hypothetical protein